MKNCYLSLILIAFLSSCSNSLFQNEESSLLALEENTIMDRSSLDILNKDSIAVMNNMYDAMDTILYPMVSFSIERISEGKLIINVPRLDKKYVYNNGKYPDLPETNVTINTGCFLQYRLHDKTIGGPENPWYYYNPDSIHATIPYYVEVPFYHPDDSRLLRLYLNPASFPQAPFDLRGRLYGITSFGTKQVKTMTEWWPSNGSYIEFRNNFNGFIENNQDSEDSRQQVNVVAEMVLNVTIDLDANHSGTYKCQFGSQTKYLQYTKGYNCLTCSFSERKTVKAYLNSTFTITMGFGGKDYNFIFYVLPGYRGDVLTSFNDAYLHMKFS